LDKHGMCGFPQGPSTIHHAVRAWGGVATKGAKANDKASNEKEAESGEAQGLHRLTKAYASRTPENITFIQTVRRMVYLHKPLFVKLVAVVTDVI